MTGKRWKRSQHNHTYGQSILNDRGSWRGQGGEGGGGDEAGRGGRGVGRPPTDRERERERLETQRRMTATWRQPFEQSSPSPLHKQTVLVLLLRLRSSSLHSLPPPPTLLSPNPHPQTTPSQAFSSTKPSLFLLPHLLIIFSFPRLFFNQPFSPSLFSFIARARAAERHEEGESWFHRKGRNEK